MAKNQTTAPEETEALDTPTEAAAPVPEDPRREALDAVFAQWTSSHLRDSPCARSTETWNHLTVTALPALKDLILKEI